jgi:hypothetical protein
VTIRPPSDFAEINHPHSWYVYPDRIAAAKSSAQQYANRTRVTQALHTHDPEAECESTCIEITPQ